MQKTTKENILSVSMELFLEKGFNTTSMQDVMKAANISKGGIYHHFASKDEILTELIKIEATALMEGAAQIFEDTHMKIREKFLSWMDLKTSFYRNKYSLLRRVFVDKSDIALRFRIIDEMKKLIKPTIEKALQENNENIPRLKETANLLLCSHELVFGYGLSEIENEEEFESYLETIRQIFGKVFS